MEPPETPAAAASPPAPPDPPPLRVGVPKETYPGERRVAATPTTVEKLRQLGLEVQVESGAGEGASILDADYAEVGARIVSTGEVFAQSDILIKVRDPNPVGDGGPHEADRMKEGACLVCFVWPAQNKELLEVLARRRITLLAMDMVPRITRAQKLDSLSAMANIAGYKAVIEAAHHYGRFLGGQMTAAGRVRPARVLVVGAGVAGLAAVAAARALGAVVKAFDTRPAVREQVESLGGEFIEFQFSESGEGEGGYAKQMSEAYLAAEQALIAQHCATSDIVITTALVPGVKAPQLITSGAVVGMTRGSVIVDLAAEQGGNCALTERDKIVEKYGVTIIGQTDLASRMSRQSSELYAATMLQLLKEVIRDGRLKLDLEDEIHRSILVLDQGKLMWPPPKPPQRSGEPQPGKDAARSHSGVAVQARPGSPWPLRIALGLALLLLIPIALFAPPAFLEHFTVFLLACIIGWHVIWNVTPALHTPLMSVTNAISGIILIGGMLLSVGRELNVPTVLGAVAVLLASINVAGGFLVTQRMLRMFHK